MKYGDIMSSASETKTTTPTTVKPFAVVESCGRQYQLEAGRYVDIDLVKKEPGQEFVFDRVLMLINGTDSLIGQPLIDGAKVTGTVLGHHPGRKIIVYKMRPKKRTRRKQGHRQDLTRIFVDRIELKDKVLAASDKKAEIMTKGSSKSSEASTSKSSTKSAASKPAKSSKASTIKAKTTTAKKATPAKSASTKSKPSEK
jgi:large subunit ribosomal protein L21